MARAQVGASSWPRLVRRAGHLHPLRDDPLSRCRDSDHVNTVGEPYSGKLNVRFDEGRLGGQCSDQPPTLPHLTTVRIEELSHEEGAVCIRARAHADEATCPGCGNVSSRVHGWYERRLTDAPISGRAVVIRLRVRKFVCQTLGCVRRI
ncbi:MAG: hypothetical protein DMG78_28845, partial [Acidobacteria bacterium]